MRRDYPAMQQINEQRPGDEDVLTPEEVADWLKVKVRWVHAHSNGGRRPQLPSFKTGKYTRFLRGDVRRAIEQMKKERT